MNPRLAAFGIGGLSLVAWAVLTALVPAAGLQGWWIAFLFWSGPALGALALALVRRLTGGRWGEAFAPELEPAARTAPLLLVLALPVAFALPWAFGWAADPAKVDPQVRALWLNTPLFLLRQLVLLGGWSLVAWRLSAIERRGDAGRLEAGLALVFHGVAVSFAASDWVASVQPGHVNSAAGMTLAVAQIAGALGWIALQGRHRPSRAASGDIGGLLFAAALGLSYLVFMAFLVAWYGDRPASNAWWLPRAQAPWGWAAGGAFALGFVAPSLVLLARHALGVRRALRASGACVLAALALYDLWLLAPTYGAACILPAAAALAAQGGAWVGLAVGGGALRSAEPVHA